MKRSMVAFLIQLLFAFRSPLTRRARLEAENLLLRQQLIVLRRKSPTRVRPWNIDRLLLVWLYRLYPSLLDAIIIVQPETVLRWHRRGFRAYWRWKSRHVGGRPRIDCEMRALIRRMSRENPLWGAPRIHGELLMLGIEVAESTRDHPTAPRSPWQNGHVERLIGSIRRESLDHLVVFDEAQLRRVLKVYASYYNEVRTHLSLGKNAPDFRRPQKIGHIAAIPILGGLHHQYVRV
jgi:hypothetical protein